MRSLVLIILVSGMIGGMAVGQPKDGDLVLSITHYTPTTTYRYSAYVSPSNLFLLQQPVFCVVVTRPSRIRAGAPGLIRSIGVLDVLPTVFSMPMDGSSSLCESIASVTSPPFVGLRWRGREHDQVVTQHAEPDMARETPKSPILAPKQPKHAL